MQKKIKYTLTFITVCLLVLLIFIGSGYLYLSYELSPTEANEESVPYYTSIPENAGVMLDICGDRLLIFMDFEKSTMSMIFDESDVSAGEELFGYSVDYIIKGDYDLLAGIVDKVSGVELEIGEEKLRYTGVQITDLLSRTAQRQDLNREITSQIIKKIKENGFQKEDFLYIIENSDTNLTLPDCYQWCDYIKGLCKNAKFIN